MEEKLTDIVLPCRLGTLNLLLHKLLGIPLLPQTQVVMVDSLHLTTSVDDRLSCALGVS